MAGLQIRVGPQKRRVLGEKAPHVQEVRQALFRVLRVNAEGSGCVYVNRDSSTGPRQTGTFQPVSE